MTEKEVKLREKQEVKGPAEPTKSGPVFLPAVDIFENEEALTLVAELPGVSQTGLQIDLKDDQITIQGEVGELTDPKERVLLREFETGRFFRQFQLSEVIDQNRISARLKNGILTLTLPKVEKAKPRKIEVAVG
jgi:HSP20 family protein